MVSSFRGLCVALQAKCHHCAAGSALLHLRVWARVKRYGPAACCFGALFQADTGCAELAWTL